MLMTNGLFLFERAMAAFLSRRSVKDSVKSETLLPRLALAEIGEFTRKRSVWTKKCNDKEARVRVTLLQVG
jgi:hypothetical protein